ncbi:MAG: HlyD family secretion protein [Flavipsychrobacter sp.]
MTTNKKKTIIAIVATAAVGIAGISAYFWMKNAVYETTDNAQLDGNIESIRSSVTAYVSDIRFKDNQQVHAGDTLIILNTTMLKAKVQEAQAALDNAMANVNISDFKSLASVENAKASDEAAKAQQQNIVAAKANLDKAQADMNRAQQLLGLNAITRVQYDDLHNKLAVATADYTKAKNQMQSSASTSQGLITTAQAERHQVSAAQALVQQRAAELTAAQQDLDHAYVTAPFSGTVTKRGVQAGQYISAGQTLCALIDNRHLWVTANFKETQLDKLQPGQDCEISVDAYPGMKIKGKVSSFLGATGAKFSLLPPDNSTGNFIKITQRFPLRIDIDSFFEYKNKPTVLFPGLSVYVKVKTK